jgi:hypothetical protein
MAATFKHPPLAPPWVDKVESHSSSCDEDEVLPSCYSKLLKADLLPGTFVVLRDDNDNNCDSNIRRPPILQCKINFALQNENWSPVVAKYILHF